MASKDNYSWDHKHLFVNPYNFVSSNFSREGNINAADEKKECTGVLKCRMITKTPVALPGDVISPDTEQHKTYDFFHYEDGSYVIPGSSVRGAVRSVYETITDSCYVTAKEDALITKRSNRPYKPGILKYEDNEWKLYKATRYKFRIKDYDKEKDSGKNCGYCDELYLSDLKKSDLHFGDRVVFKQQNKYDKNGRLTGLYARKIKKSSDSENYLYLGEFIDGKRFEGVFKKGEKINVKKETLQMAISRMEETIRLYNDENINRNLENGHTGYAGYERAKENEAVPLWYQDNLKTGTLSLSIACLGRVAYQNTMGDLLKRKKPCKNREKLCKACALFGMAADEKLGSRVRFSDAVIEKDNIINMKQGHLHQLMLDELASPKPSYLPFYLKESRNPTDIIYGYDAREAQLRGRKFYWHASEVRTTQEPTKRNATMEVIKSNQQGFKFNVYYDNISQEQLKELIWTLTLGENDENGNLCYKIGHGKPIGLGSVKIVIDEQIERIYGKDYEVKSHIIGEVEDVFKNNDIKQELLHIMDIDRMKEKDVRYPYVQGQKDSKDNDRAAHQWFRKNYALGAKPKPAEYYLPKIRQDCSLPSATYNGHSRKK